MSDSKQIFSYGAICKDIEQHFPNIRKPRVRLYPQWCYKYVWRKQKAKHSHIKQSVEVLPQEKSREKWSCYRQDIPGFHAFSYDVQATIFFGLPRRAEEEDWSRVSAQGLYSTRIDQGRVYGYTESLMQTAQRGDIYCQCPIYGLKAVKRGNSWLAALININLNGKFCYQPLPQRFAKMGTKQARCSTLWSSRLGNVHKTGLCAVSEYCNKGIL